MYVVALLDHAERQRCLSWDGRRKAGVLVLDSCRVCEVLYLPPPDPADPPPDPMPEPDADPDPVPEPAPEELVVPLVALPEDPLLD